MPNDLFFLTFEKQRESSFLPVCSHELVHPLSASVILGQVEAHRVTGGSPPRDGQGSDSCTLCTALQVCINMKLGSAAVRGRSTQALQKCGSSCLNVIIRASSVPLLVCLSAPAQSELITIILIICCVSS